MISSNSSIVSPKPSAMSLKASHSPYMQLRGTVENEWVSSMKSSTFSKKCITIMKEHKLLLLGLTIDEPLASSRDWCASQSLSHLLRYKEESLLAEFWENSSEACFSMVYGAHTMYARVLTADRIMSISSLYMSKQ